MYQPSLMMSDHDDANLFKPSQRRALKRSSSPVIAQTFRGKRHHTSVKLEWMAPHMHCWFSAHKDCLYLPACGSPGMVVRKSDYFAKKNKRFAVLVEHKLLLFNQEVTDLSASSSRTWRVPHVRHVCFLIDAEGELLPVSACP
jgi:hypothetical protein